MSILQKSVLVASLLAACSIACGVAPEEPGQTGSGREPGVSANVYASHCSDMVKDDGETGVDCGGGCAPCPNGSHCLVDSDCVDACGSNGYCQGAGVDGIQDGNESDVDCGGTYPSSSATAGCAVGKDCYTTANCVAGSLCVDLVCAGPSCTDGLEDGNESDVDCGGGTCLPCANGKKCNSASDCAVGATCSASAPPATQKYCRDPGTCTNGHFDPTLGETATDCGGPCNPCANGLACKIATDCQSGVCSGNICQVPTCFDNVKNGTESSVDCGGSCAPCGLGQVCSANGDCGTGMSCASDKTCAATVNLCLTATSPYYRAVVCNPTGACTVGVCNPLTGTCTNEAPVANGTSCPGPTANGTTASCQAGICTPTCNAGYAPGPNDTCVDINECALGTDTCTSYQTCTNTPGSYTCTNIPGAPMTFVQEGSGASTEKPQASTFDHAGNFYVAGMFQTNVLTGGYYPCYGAGCGYADEYYGGAVLQAGIVKYSSTMQPIWVKLWDTRLSTNNEANIASAITAITVDSSNNIYAAGITAGQIAQSDGNPSTGYTDAFVVKLDSSSNQIWSWQTAAQYGTTADDLTVGPSGEVYVTGSTWGNLLTGTGGSSAFPLNDVFVARIDAAAGATTGTTTWIEQFGSNVTDMSSGGAAIGISPTGHLIVAGSTSGNLITGSGPATSGDFDYFTAEFSMTTGARLWLQQRGAAGETLLGLGSQALSLTEQLAFDSAGDIYIAGSTNGNIVTGTGPSIGTKDAFLAKLTPTGSAVWTRELGVPAEATAGDGIGISAAGNVFVTGHTYGNLSSGSGAAPGNALDSFMVAYDESGNQQWLTQTGSGSITETFGVSVDASGNPWTAGYTNGNLLGPGSGAPFGTDDLFIAGYVQ